MPDLKCNLCEFVADPLLMTAHNDYSHDGEASPRAATQEESRMWLAIVRDDMDVEV